jgi:hypothetical protein
MMAATGNICAIVIYFASYLKCNATLLFAKIMDVGNGDFMKTILFVLVFVVLCFATVSLSGTPIWQSASPTGYATGGAWADINNDANHYLDLVVSTGNDIEANRNIVYFNNGVMLATTPGWQSNDVDFHGHCDVADYNHDGYLDLAVAGFGVYSPYTPTPDRVYKNTGNSSGLPTVPTWQSDQAYNDYTFGIAWGDYDGDGDLDLATASSYDYLSYKDKFKIYRNDNGTLTTYPVWQSASDYYAMDVEFADINGDGRLDLVAACSGNGEHNLVFLNKGAGYNSTPDWESADSGRTIQIAVGDFDGDGWLDLAAADNAQLGGQSEVKVYHNINGTLETTPSWHSDLDKNYYSCVAWADCDMDGYPELAAGGWWEPAVVFDNSHGILNPTPVWSWSTSNPDNLVCESVLWGDMDGLARIDVTDESHTANGTAKCFYAIHRPLERMTTVKINDAVQQPSTYCWHPLGGWVSFATAPSAGSSVRLSYTYSYAPDLAVTNWQNSDHNYVFANLGNIGVNLTCFEASAARNGGALVRWSCADETAVLGYNLYRRKANEPDTKWVLVNQKPIIGVSPHAFHDAGADEPIIWQYSLEADYGDGLTQHFGPILANLRGTSVAVALAAPAPNPARTIANLRYSCREGGGRLEIFDLAGRLIHKWDIASSTGQANLTWDLRDSAGQKVATGVYQVILSSAGMTKTRRLVVSR